VLDRLLQPARLPASLGQLPLVAVGTAHLGPECLQRVAGLPRVRAEERIGDHAGLGQGRAGPGPALGGPAVQERPCPVLRADHDEPPGDLLPVPGRRRNGVEFPGIQEVREELERGRVVLGHVVLGCPAAGGDLHDLRVGVLPTEAGQHLAPVGAHLLYPAQGGIGRAGHSRAHDPPREGDLWQIRHLEPPLVGALEVPLHELEPPASPQRPLVALGKTLHHSVERGPGVLHPTHRREVGDVVQVGRRRLPRAPDRPLQEGEGILVAGPVGVGDGEVVEGGPVVGIAGQNPLVRLDLGGQVTGDGPVVVGHGVAPLQLGEALPELVGPGGGGLLLPGLAPRGLDHHGQLAPGHGEPRVELHGGLQVALRLAVLSGLAQLLGLGVEAERLERRGRDPLQGGLGLDGAQGLARLLPDVLGEAVDGVDDLVRAVGRAPEGGQGVAGLGGADRRGQDVARARRAHVALDDRLDPAPDRHLPGHVGGKPFGGLPLHQAQDLLHPGGGDEGDRPGGGQVHPERLGHHAVERGVVGAVLEVGEDHRLALLEDPLGLEVAHGPDPRGPHDPVRDHGEAQEGEGGPGAQEGVPPGEEPVERRRPGAGEVEGSRAGSEVPVGRCVRCGGVAVGLVGPGGSSVDGRPGAPARSPGAAIALSLLPRHPFLDERRGDHHRQPDQEKDEGHPRGPVRQAHALGHHLHDLEHAPGHRPEDPHDLPEGSAVDLVDELFELVHGRRAGP